MDGVSCRVVELDRDYRWIGIWNFGGRNWGEHCLGLEGSRQETICRTSSLDGAVLHVAVFGCSYPFDRRGSNVDGHFNRVGLCKRGLAQLAGALVGL